MENINPLDNIYGQPYIIADNETIIEASQSFFDMTGYSADELLNRKIHDIFRNLRVGPNFNIKSIEAHAEYFLFTKSLEARFVNIQSIKLQGKELYVFIEKPDSRLDDKLVFVEQMFKDNVLGTAVYSAPDLILIKANQKYLDFMNPPFNKMENSMGKSIREIIAGFSGSQGEAVWNTVLETQKTNYIKEFLFDGFEIGATYWDSTKTPVFENGKMKYIFETAQEVTERVLNRKKIEEQVEAVSLKQKEMLDAIFNNISDGIFIFDKSGKIMMLNEEAKELVYPADSWGAVGDSYATTTYFYEDGSIVPIGETPTYRALRGETVKDEKLMVRQPHREGIFEFSSSPVFDDNGNIDMVITCVHNITGLIQREKTIQQQKEKLQLFMDNMSDGLYLLDKNKEVTFLNNAVRNYFYNPESFRKVGDSLAHTKYFDINGNRLTIDDLPGVRALKGENVEECFYKVEMPDKTMYCCTTGRPIHNRYGDIEYAFICMRDITEKIIYEQKIEKQNEQLKAIISSMSDGLELVDNELNITFLNQSAKGFFYNPEAKIKAGDSVKYNKYYYGIDGEEIPREDLPAFRIFKKGSFQNYILTIDRPDKKIYASVNGSPVCDKDGFIKEAVLCLRDITEQVALEISLISQQKSLLQAEREKNEALEKAIEMKDEFLSLISHEFRTPLNVINTAIQALNYIYADEMTDKVKEYIGTIKQNTFRQLRLVNNLLDITRAHAGSIKIDKKNMDIVFLTKSITESVYEYALKKGVRITYVSALKKMIIGIDDEKYERIILNFLSNSIKFTPEGKSITVSLRSLKGSICIEVKDTGIGIPPNKVDIIFERFGQVDSSLSRQAEGTGIGLSLVKKFVEALGGSISVKSRVGKGSTFTIMLPNEMVVEESHESAMGDSMDNRRVQITNVEFSDIYF